MANRITFPRTGLSLQFLTATALSVDWSALRDYADGDPDAVRPILPAPTYGDWQDRAAPAPDHIERRKASAIMSDADREAFEQTDAHDEWRDSFEPMMNYAWPVSLAYGVAKADAVAAIEQFGGACSLIELSEAARERLFGNDSDAPEYVIALTGGGMDLSDHIAGAYLACGCIPPQRILSGLSGVISSDKAHALRLRQVYQQAARHFRYMAYGMRDQPARIFADRGAR